MEAGSALGKYYWFKALGPILSFYIAFGLAWGAVRMFQGRWNLEATLLSLVILTPILLLFCTVLIAIYPIKVYPWGLRSYNSFGIFKKLTWSEHVTITSVTPWWGLTWLALRKEGEGKWTALWVPLCLDNESAFRVMIMRAAPPGHPLRTYFESH